jgi:hypothetical protein
VRIIRVSSSRHSVSLSVSDSPPRNRRGIVIVRTFYYHTLICRLESFESFSKAFPNMSFERVSVIKSCIVEDGWDDFVEQVGQHLVPHGWMNLQEPWFHTAS